MNTATKPFHVVNLGKYSEIDYKDAQLPKKFLKELLHLTGMEISVTTIPAGVSFPFFHSHKENEELYIVVQGSGQIQADNELIDISEGSMVSMRPEVKRSIRASTETELIYLCIQAKVDSLNLWTKTDGIRNPESEWVKD
jgi:mannose-6-phosphate isomerase-like protein (cupin superfamily)